MRVRVEWVRAPLCVYVWFRGMVIVPLVEMMMQYMSGLREIWMLVVMLEELEGCDRKYEPSGNFRSDVCWEGWGRCWVGGCLWGWCG